MAFEDYKATPQPNDRLTELAHIGVNAIEMSGKLRGERVMVLVASDELPGYNKQGVAIIQYGPEEQGDIDYKILAKDIVVFLQSIAEHGVGVNIMLVERKKNW